jgi:hypothetical protein
VAFADGSVRFLALPLSPSLATALLTADGGEIIDDRAFDRASLPQLDYGKIYSLATFVALSLLPAGRLLRRRSKPIASCQSSSAPCVWPARGNNVAATWDPRQGLQKDKSRGQPTRRAMFVSAR